MKSENMVSIAYEYFMAQPGYALAIAPQVKAEVKRHWLEGCEVGEVCKRMFGGDLMVHSVISCKSFIMAIVTIDIDSEANTRAIIYGFFTYIERVFNEIEAEFEANKPDWLKEVDERIEAVLKDAE